MCFSNTFLGDKDFNIVCAYRLAKTSKARFSRNVEVYKVGKGELDDKVTFL